MDAQRRTGLASPRLKPTRGEGWTLGRKTSRGSAPSSARNDRAQRGRSVLCHAGAADSAAPCYGESSENSMRRQQSTSDD
eukprot:5984957-Pleurochrysis_carterae.AAC.3